MTKVEYIIATSAACQMVWLRRILNNCGKGIMDSSLLWCDNQSTIAIAKNPALYGGTKHIDARLHFIRGLVVDGAISLLHCNTGEQLVGIFTKPLLVEKHKIIQT